MRQKHVKKLPVVDQKDQLVGMYVWNDVKNDKRKRDSFSLDSEGHFLVAAAIGLSPDDINRADLLIQSGCKIIVIDCSHGACKPAKDVIHALKEKYSDKVDLICGNIASYESAKYLLEGNHVPDGLKVGIGPGSICTTRSVTGHGIPQVTAIYEVWRAVRDFGARTGIYIPIIADGGIKSSGDIVKCFSVGATSVMLGSVFAGTTESPGQLTIKGGKTYKTIRGMGSRSAMEERSGSRVRYYRNSKKYEGEHLTNEQKVKVVPEGVSGLVEFKGPLERVMYELLGGISAGLAHSGAKTILSFQKKATFWVQSFAGIKEGEVHNITDVQD